MKILELNKKQPPPTIIDVPALEVSQGHARRIMSPLNREYLLTLSINGNEYSAMACSGNDLALLSAGFALSEGIITSIDEITEIRIDYSAMTADLITSRTDELIERLLILRTIPSGCGQASIIPPDITPFTHANIHLPADRIPQMMKSFITHSAIHKLTHGVHSAAVYTLEGEQRAFFDEIGRHNAIDKALGYTLANDINRAEVMIFSTGRISSEIVLKMIKAGAGILISKASPTSLSFELAKRSNMVLIGKVHGPSFTVFHGSDYIIFDEDIGPGDGQKPG